MQNQNKAQKSQIPIAVIGVSCRLPGQISTPDEFWRFCCQARSAWSEIPSSRFSADAYYHPNPDQQGATNTRGGHFLDDVAHFDAAFFEMSAEEAMAADPQQRLMLECAYEAIESAGISKAKVAGERVGVFAAGSFSDYELSNFRDFQNTPTFQATGCAASFLSNRLSHFFDFTGPSLTVDTACSSSLSALHLACQSLKSGESTHALVGGSHLNLTPDYYISYSLLRLFSDSGKCFSFDHRGSSGFGRGEGVGCVMLKRLDDAIAAGDTIRAVIANTGINQDGHTPGIGVPSSKAQKRLMETVYQAAGINPRETGYVEAHGTGTKTGDPIEARALHEFFGHDRPRETPLLVGSVKSNFGHAEGASGIVSVVKTVMMLEKGFVLPNCNFERCRDDIPMDRWGLRVPTKLVPWPKGKSYACINNFGIGGTNAMAILQKAPKRRSLVPRKRGPPIRRAYVFSGSDEDAVLSQAKGIKAYLQAHPEQFDNQLIANLAYTLCERRTVLPWKAAVSARSTKELISVLDGKIQARRSIKVATVAFVFTGQGAQWYAMGRELFSAYPVFAESMRKADEHLSGLRAGFTLTDELFKDELKSLLSRPKIGQSACTAIQIALTDLLRSWGVTPKAVIGHSSGEIAAAYAAGVVGFGDALTLAFGRGLAAESLRKDHANLKGGMVVVRTSLDDAKALVSDVTQGRVSIACINSPRSITVSGSQEGLAELQKLADSRLISYRRLKVDVAYHSHHMEQVADKYQAVIKDIVTADSDTAFYSSARGRRLAGSSLQPSYWIENFVSPVLFSTGLSTLLKESSSASKISCLVEIGPSASLESPIKDILKLDGIADPPSYIASLRKDKDAVEAVHDMVGMLFLHSQALNFPAINFPQADGPKPRLLTDLPRYSWNHTKPYWHSTRIGQNTNHPRFPRNELIGARLVESNELHPQWRMILRADDHPWVRHHQFDGYNVYPLAGYVAMAIEAVSQQAIINNIDYNTFNLREVSASKALVVPNTSAVEVMISLQPHAEGTRNTSSTWTEFHITSWTENKGWEENCHGLISVQNSLKSNPINGEMLLQSQSEAVTQKLSTITTACKREISPQALYDEAIAHGIKYGPYFKALDGCYVHKDNAMATAVLPDLASDISHQYPMELFLHPTTIDICFQIVWPVLGAGSKDLGKQYLPSSIKHLIVPKQTRVSTGERLRIYGECSSRISTDQPANLNIWAVSDANPEGLILQAEGFVMTPILDKDTSGSAVLERQLCYKFDMVPHVGFMKKDQLSSGGPGCQGNKLANSRKMRLLKEASEYYVKRAVRAVSQDEGENYIAGHPQFLAWCSNPSFSASDIPPNVEEVYALGGSGEIVCDLGDQLPQILQGELDALSIIEKRGGLGKYIVDVGSLHQNYQQMADCIDKMANQNPGMAILEVGAATGSAVLPILERLGGGGTGQPPKFQKYILGNVPESSLAGARSRIQEWADLVSVQPLDLATDLLSQDCQAGSFDAAVVHLHRTCLTEQVLQNIYKVLKSGGKLFAVQDSLSESVHLPQVLLSPECLVERQDDTENGSDRAAEYAKMLQTAGFSGADTSVNDAPGDLVESTWSVLTAVRSENALWGRKVALVFHEELEWFPLSALAERVEAMTGSTVQIQMLTQDTKVEDLCIFVGEVERPLLSETTPEVFQSIQDLLTTASGALWIVRDAYAGCKNAAANMSAGLIRTVRSETGLPLATLDTDIDETSPTQNVVDDVLNVFKYVFGPEASTDQVDLEFVSRKGIVSVPRIKQDTLTNRAVYQDPNEFSCVQQQLYQEGRPLQLAIREYGMLSSLYFTDNEKLLKPLEDGWLELDVHFVGLNFKDVMHANNQISVDGFGIECSGVVTAVGKHVEGFRVGDRICAITEGCLASKTRCRAAGAWVVPEEMPLEVAAIIPVVFCTAFYSLNRAAMLMEGESVLIHAAAGGVGQAAIILAQTVGANIFATVGSVEKKQFLMETYGIPDSQIFFSRDLSFVEGVKFATDGKGVDVLLNSLAGDAMRASLECIAPFGRFVEIGKRDIMANSHMEMLPFDRNVSFTAVDMGVFARDRPKLMQDLFSNVFGLFENGLAKPTIPIKRYSVSDVEAAFLMLQSGRSIGKVVVSLRKESMIKVSPATRMVEHLREDGSYIVIGASGGLGQSITSWLASHGARNIILVCRQKTSIAAIQGQMDSLQEKGINVHAVQCDISDKGQVETVLLALTANQDVLFERMTFEEYDTVIRPKVHGIWNVSQVLETVGCTLDFFIALSSIAGIIGNRGQAAYSAASTFLDAFAKSQRAQGTPFTTIDLAPLWDIGYLATDATKRDQVRNTFGSEAITEREFHRLLAAVIFTNNPARPVSDHIITGMTVPADPTDQKRLEWLSDPKFSHLVRAAAASSTTTQSDHLPAGAAATIAAKIQSPGEAIKTARTHDEALHAAETALVHRISEVVMCPAEDIDRGKPIMVSGVDSLSAIGVRKWIVREMEASLSLFDITNSPSVAQLARLCLEKSKLEVPGRS
ncbi:fatty acid synthase S-acetyltransferase [Aspergillus campestris IBT 28561]|uniref:Fatty acid synthase S-acetyltransferase n=1 Tax=Aspergillus campestris (strain IBT 28561) TaxID=1392248 RepID=A0A2I1DF00_ASPC2|nr:fatty acid synthase S-acetyltransferase [Aspergillus campestris IBT 28561]PKY08441.1 fatty acid synthase S-acetyltransferase [Aspergillus campestris IBT 28561]